MLAWIAWLGLGRLHRIAGACGRQPVQIDGDGVSPFGSAAARDCTAILGTGSRLPAVQSWHSRASTCAR